MTRLLIVSNRTTVRDQVSATCAELDGADVVGVITGDDRLWLPRTADGDIDVVLIDEEYGGGGLDVARELSLINPLLGIVILVGRATPDTIAAAMDAGARSVIQLPPSLEEFRTRIDAVGQWVRSARRQVSADAAVPEQAGRVIAIVGAKGGVGASVLSLLVARDAVAAGPTCVADLDVRKGDLTAYSGAVVRRTIVDLVEVADELSGRALGEATYQLAHGIRLLPAPTDIEDAEVLTSSATRQIVSALRHQYSTVVLDCGTRLDEVSATAMEQADAIIVVTTSDAPAYRSARRLVESLERLDIATRGKLHLFVNKTSRSSDVQPALGPKVVGIPLVGTAPRLGANLEGPMNTATLLDARLPELDKGIRAIRATVDPSVGEPAGRSATVRKTRARRSRADAVPEAGQIMVETPVVIGLAVLVLLVCVQMVLWGATHLISANAAQEAARSYSVGNSRQAVVQDVEQRIPGIWSPGWRMGTAGADTVTVTLRTPSMIPALLPDVTSEATIVWER